MKILVTLERGQTWDIYYPREICERLETLGEIIYNQTGAPLTPGELKKRLNEGMDICLTHWNCPVFDEEALRGNAALKLIAHSAGSVAGLVSDHVYDRGIAVCSANAVMAQYVAEVCLALILSAVRLVPEADRRMKAGEAWPALRPHSDPLFYKKVSLIGLGAVGRSLCRLLKPFSVKVKVYDPYVGTQDLQTWGMEEIELVSLEEALSSAEIVSVHASLTPETVGLLGGRQLAMIPDGALLVNTARGKIIEQDALTAELKSGRIRAALDVFETEPLPLDSALRKLDNVILTPHLGGSSSKSHLTAVMLDEIERFVAGMPLEYQVPYATYKRMAKAL